MSRVRGKSSSPTPTTCVLAASLRRAALCSTRARSRWYGRPAGVGGLGRLRHPALRLARPVPSHGPDPSAPPAADSVACELPRCRIPGTSAIPHRGFHRQRIGPTDGICGRCAPAGAIVAADLAMPPGSRICSSRQHGLLTLAQAVAHGVSASAVSRRVAAGRWQRVLPRVYATFDARASRKHSGSGLPVLYARRGRGAHWLDGPAAPPDPATSLTLPGPTIQCRHLRCRSPAGEPRLRTVSTQQPPSDVVPRRWRTDHAHRSCADRRRDPRQRRTTRPSSC